MTDDEMWDYVKKARVKIFGIGPTDPLWDTIIDAEMILQGADPGVPRDIVEARLKEGVDDGK